MLAYGVAEAEAVQAGEPGAAGEQHRAAGRAGQQVAHLGQVAGVVQQDEHLPGGEHGAQPVGPVVPAREVGGVLGQLRRSVGPGRNPEPCRVARLPPGSGGEDLLLEPVQAGTRAGAQLLGERAADVRVDVECVHLPSGLVQRCHQQLVDPLAPRVFGGQRAQRTERVVVPAQHDLGLPAGLGGRQAQFLQPGALGLGVRTGHAGGRLAAPQVQRGDEQ
nr:hypothetical protein [Streptomyces klenkii]